MLVPSASISNLHYNTFGWAGLLSSSVHFTRSALVNRITLVPRTSAILRPMIFLRRALLPERTLLWGRLPNTRRAASATLLFIPSPRCSVWLLGQSTITEGGRQRNTGQTRGVPHVFLASPRRCSPTLCPTSSVHSRHIPRHVGF